jgi:hypothetical protein
MSAKTRDERPSSIAKGPLYYGLGVKHEGGPARAAEQKGPRKMAI